jgi:hypothetical protein
MNMLFMGVARFARFKKKHIVVRMDKKTMTKKLL